MKTRLSTSPQQLLVWLTKLHYGGGIVRDAPEVAYRVSNGWIDRGRTDFLLEEVNRYIEDPSVTANDKADLRWSRAFLLWDLGRFESAAADFDFVAQSTRSDSYRRAAKLNLEKIALGRLPNEVLDGG